MPAVECEVRDQTVVKLRWLGVVWPYGCVIEVCRANHEVLMFQECAELW
jgi:hypothetical protein